MGRIAQRGFVRFWLAEATSDFGRYISTLAISVLVVLNLHGSALELGLVNAARWLPYAFLGLLAGVAADRVPRGRILVASDLAASLVLAAMFLAAILGHLPAVLLLPGILLFGTASLFRDTAQQSILPQLVPDRLLLHANVRLEQSRAAAQTAGPAIAGVLIQAIGAPFALLVDAAAHVFSGIVNASISASAPPPAPRVRVSAQLAEGLRWIYHHHELRSLSLNTNLWFLFHAGVGVVLAPYILTGLRFAPPVFGAVLTLGGIGAMVGTSLLSTRLAGRLGMGRAIGIARTLFGPAIALMALAPVEGRVAQGLLPLLLVGGGQFIYGVAMGIESPLEMAFRQAITPAALLGRTNSTMRSTNRAMVVIGAPLGGAIADALGFHAALWVAALGMLAVAVWYALSPMNRADMARAADVPTSG